MYPGSAAQLELIRLICLIPMRSLKPSVLHSAIFAWHWISVSAVDLQVDFFFQGCSAWPVLWASAPKCHSHPVSQGCMW